MIGSIGSKCSISSSRCVHILLNLFNSLNFLNEKSKPQTRKVLQIYHPNVSVKDFCLTFGLIFMDFKCCFN